MHAMTRRLFVSGSRGAVGRRWRWTASTHFFVWNDPLCAFYVRLWPCVGLASIHFL